MTTKPTFFQPDSVVERDIPYVPIQLDVKDVRLNEFGELTLLSEEQQRLIDTLPELQEDKRYSKKEITDAFRRHQNSSENQTENNANHSNNENNNNNIEANPELMMPYTMIRYRGVPAFVYKKEVEVEIEEGVKTKKNLGVLGEGNFGAVKLILGNGRLHTLKLQTKNIENAKQEFELLNKLGSANKKPLPERTTKEGLNQYSIIMELAHGITAETLKDKEAEAGDFLISPALRLQLAIEILKEIHELHKKHGILHRDLKDANVIIDVINQRIELIDFGLAAEMDAEGKVQDTLKGSPVAYSPRLREKAQQYSIEEKKSSAEKATRERSNSTGTRERSNSGSGTRERRNSGSGLLNSLRSMFDTRSSGQRSPQQKTDPTAGMVIYNKETDGYAGGILVADLLYLFNIPEGSIEAWKEQNYIYQVKEDKDHPLLPRFVNTVKNVLSSLNVLNKDKKSNNNNAAEETEDSIDEELDENPVEEALNSNPLPRKYVDKILGVLHKLALYKQKNTKQLTIPEAISMLEEIKADYLKEHSRDLNAKVPVYMLNVEDYLALRKDDPDLDKRLAAQLLGKEVWFIDTDQNRDMKVYLEIKQALELNKLWVGDKVFSGSDLKECEKKVKNHLAKRPIPSNCWRFNMEWVKQNTSRNSPPS